MTQRRSQRMFSSAHNALKNRQIRELKARLSKADARLGRIRDLVENAEMARPDISEPFNLDSMAILRILNEGLTDEEVYNADIQ